MGHRKTRTAIESAHALRLADSILGFDKAPPAAAKSSAAAPSSVLDLQSKPDAPNNHPTSPWSAFEALQGVIWRLDLRSGRTDLVKEAIPLFAEVFGVDHHCLEEGRFGFVSHAHPDDRDRILAMLASGIDKPFRTQFRVVDKDAQERWIQLKVARLAQAPPPMCDSLWFFAENVTEETVEAEKQKRILASRILSSLFGSDLSELKPEELSSQGLLAKISEKWKPLIEEKGVRWIGPDLVPLGPTAQAAVVDGAEALLFVLTDSILENALEYAATAPAPWVRFEYFEDKHSIYFAISDSGHGVPLIHRGQVFEPFFSTKPESSTGLGLTLARSAAEWHGGTLRLDHFSKNTRFVAQIPKRFRAKTD